MTFLRRLLPFVMLLFAAGCSAVPETVPAERTDAVDVLSTLMAVQLPEAFSAEGSISVSSPTMEQSAGFEMIARGDDSLKMTIFGPFGITLGTALFIPGQFTAFSALNNTVYRGSPERQLRSLPFVNAIPFEFIMGTLQGMHILSPAALHGKIVLQDTLRVMFTAVYPDSSVDSLRYDAAFGRIVSCTRYSSAGTEQWSIRYQYTRNAEGVVVPQQASVTVPQRNTTLVIEYDAVAANAAAAEFTIPVPDDAETVTYQ